MKRDPLVEIEVGIRGDTAVSLGHAARKLKAAIARLGEARADQRARLRHVAADALWGYVVQRELLGLTDHSQIAETYGVATDVWRLMGAQAPR